MKWSEKECVLRRGPCGGEEVRKTVQDDKKTEESHGSKGVQNGFYFCLYSTDAVLGSI